MYVFVRNNSLWKTPSVTKMTRGQFDFVRDKVKYGSYGSPLGPSSKVNNRSLNWVARIIIELCCRYDTPRYPFIKVSTPENLTLFLIQCRTRRGKGRGLYLGSLPPVKNVSLQITKNPKFRKEVASDTVA